MANVLSNREFHPINTSGVKIEKEGSQYRFTQEKVPNKLSPGRERYVVDAFMKIRRLKSFMRTKAMKRIHAVMEKERINERIANGDITKEKAKQIIAGVVGKGEAEELHTRWLREFGNRKGEQIIESGYHHGCGDVANVFKHLMDRAGIPCRIVIGTSMHTDKGEAKRAEANGSGHDWNEVWNGNYWVPVDAGSGKIGFKPLEMAPNNKWRPLAPTEISNEQVLGKKPTGWANPHIHKISPQTKKRLAKKGIKF